MKKKGKKKSVKNNERKEGEKKIKERERNRKKLYVVIKEKKKMIKYNLYKGEMEDEERGKVR